MTTQPDSRSIEYAAYIMVGSVVVTLGFGIWWASGGPDFASDQRDGISTGTPAEGARAARDASPWFSQVLSSAPSPAREHADVPIHEPPPKPPPQPRDSALPALIRPPLIRQARPFNEGERHNQIPEAASLALPSTGPVVQTSPPPEELRTEPAASAQPPPDAQHADSNATEAAMPLSHRTEAQALGMGGANPVQ